METTHQCHIAKQNGQEIRGSNGYPDEHFEQKRKTRVNEKIREEPKPEHVKGEKYEEVS